MAKFSRIYLLFTNFSLIFFSRREVSTASQPNACDLPGSECRIDSFHVLEDTYAREFLSVRELTGFICESSKNGTFRSNLSTRLAEVHLNTTSCLKEIQVYGVYDLKFRRDHRTRLDENSNLQGMIDYMFRLAPMFTVYLRNLGGFGVDLGLRENFSTYNNTPVETFQITSINTVFHFYKHNNGKRIESCQDMKLDNGTTLIPNSIFQMTPKNEYSTMVFLNCKFK